MFLYSIFYFMTKVSLPALTVIRHCVACSLEAFNNNYYFITGGESLMAQKLHKSVIRIRLVVNPTLSLLHDVFINDELKRCTTTEIR